MIVRLFCPKCAYEVSRSLVDYAEVDVPMPISRLSDSGEYEVVCGRGHSSLVILNNLKFELLFEMGLNALVDGYGREAVSSFATALERFYEFYWRVAMAHAKAPEEGINGAWKALSRQSERQLGAYISASLSIAKEGPRLLNTNKEVEFRNNVVHKGYIPTAEEAAEFGDAIMTVINNELETLRRIAPEALIATYKALLPPQNDKEKSTDEITGRINILTPVDVMTPPKPGDGRLGNVLSQFARIRSEREPKRLALLSKEEMKRRHLRSFRD
jgi:hypothetical protein